MALIHTHNLRWWLQLVEADSPAVVVANWHRSNAELSKFTGWSVNDIQHLGSTYCRAHPKPKSEAAYRKGMADSARLGSYLAYLFSK